MTGLHAAGASFEFSPLGRGFHRLAPEVKGIILSHLKGDTTSLRSCTLVCASWAALARPYLFQKVVCRPAVPTRTWDDFIAFLVTSPNIARLIRWLTVDGSSTIFRSISDFELQHVVEALDRIPSLTRLYIQHMRFQYSAPQPNAIRTASTLYVRRRCERPVYLKMLSVSSCRVESIAPLYELLASITGIETFALHGLSLKDSYAQPVPGPLAIRIDAIQVDGYPLGEHFWTTLRHRLPSMASRGLTASRRSLAGGRMAVSTRLIGGRMAVTSLLELLTVLREDVHSLCVNVLGACCFELGYVVTGAPTWPPPGNTIPIATAFPRNSEFPDFPRVDLSAFNSIRHIVLYITTTSAIKTSWYATRLYGRQLANNWSLLSNAPTSLRHIELRFQRYGPHTRSMVDDLRAINDPSAYPEKGRWSSVVNEGTLARFPPHVRAMLDERRAADARAPLRTRWSTLDEGIIIRFSELQAFTCVLCDGGFIEQYGPFLGDGVDVISSASDHCKQQEFDDYVELLKDVLPRLHESGLMRFRISEI